MKLDSLSITTLFHPLISFLRRFHTLMFFLLVSGGLAAAILVLISIVSVSSLTASTSDQTINGTFDQTTIDRIQRQASPAQPSGRLSPFVE
jgi:hypothetical protein